MSTKKTECNSTKKKTAAEEVQKAAANLTASPALSDSYGRRRRPENYTPGPSYKWSLRSGRRVSGESVSRTVLSLSLAAEEANTFKMGQQEGIFL